MTLNTHIQNQLIHVEQRYFKNISINIDQYMNSSMQNRYVKTPKLLYPNGVKLMIFSSLEAIANK